MEAQWTRESGRETEVELCKHSGCPKRGPSLTFLKKKDPASLRFTSALNQTPGEVMFARLMSLDSCLYLKEEKKDRKRETVSDRMSSRKLPFSDPISLSMFSILEEESHLKTPFVRFYDKSILWVQCAVKI